MMHITTLTRQDIFEIFERENINWAGDLSDRDFLSELYPKIENIPPEIDNRCKNFADEIYLHTEVFSEDWERNWVFYNNYFNLKQCSDEEFLIFLCQTIDPHIRRNKKENEYLCKEYNSILIHDGYTITIDKIISGRPVFKAEYIGINENPSIGHVVEISERIDAPYLRAQVNKIDKATRDDPSLAIGLSKELLESICKEIIGNHEKEMFKNKTFTQIFKIAINKTPSITEKFDIDDPKHTKFLNNLSSIVQTICEIRNQYGTGHGHGIHPKTPPTRYAKLTAGVTYAVAVFMWESYQESNKND